MALWQLAIPPLLFVFSKAKIKCSELQSAREDFRLNMHSQSYNREVLLLALFAKASSLDLWATYGETVQGE